MMIFSRTLHCHPSQPVTPSASAALRTIIFLVAVLLSFLFTVGEASALSEPKKRANPRTSIAKKKALAPKSRREKIQSLLNQPEVNCKDDRYNSHCPLPSSHPQGTTANPDLVMAHVPENELASPASPKRLGQRKGVIYGTKATPHYKLIQANTVDLNSDQYNITTNAARQKLSREVKPESKKSWAASLGYRSSTDVADPVRPRLFRHSMQMGVSLETASKLSLSAGTSVLYQSIGNKVREDGNDDPQFNDISLAVRYPIGGQNPDQLAVKGSTGISLPTSREAKFEGYYAILSQGFVRPLAFFANRFVLAPGLNFTYAANRYEYSPQTNSVLQDGSADATLSATVVPILGIGLTYRFGVTGYHYLDQSWSNRTVNSLSLSYSSPQKMLTVSVGMSNGSYPDKVDVPLWFVDEYRRDVFGAMAVTF